VRYVGQVITISGWLFVRYVPVNTVCIISQMLVSLTDVNVCCLLFVLDPYYNIPLEKVKSILSRKENYLKRLCNWNPDFVVSCVPMWLVKMPV